MAGKQSGGTSIWTWLLLGGAGYLAYEWFFAPSSAAAPSATTPPATGGQSTLMLPSMLNTGGASNATTAAAPNSSFNSLDAIYQRLAQKMQSVNDPAVTQSGTAATPDIFNYYLGQVSSYQLSASAMGQLFGPEPAGSQPVTLAGFWSAASGWLAQNKGLSGFGGRGLAGIFAASGRRR